jgi:hypothetical protein
MRACSCLPDGAQWTSNPLTECCAGFAFGQYCGCVPDGLTTRWTCLECCSRFCPTGDTCG